MVQSTFKIEEDCIIGVQVQVRAYKVQKFKDKKCGYCGKKFTPTHPHNLYCSKSCRYYSDLEHTNERKRRYRSKFHGAYNDRSILNVGTGGLGCHACADFDEEYRKIQSERRKLGL